MTHDQSAAQDASGVTDILDWLAADIALRPGRLRVIGATLRERIRPLVEGVEFDLDAPLRDADE